jgi:hopene-associated glycosyltransferase HpnB
MSFALLAIALWIGLLLFRGGFWLADVRLAPNSMELERWPSVCAIVPARDEATVLSETLPSLLTQHYPGNFRIVLVDDRSEDGTADLAQALAQEYGATQRLQVVSGSPLPTGWSGKLWAMEQGIQSATQDQPDFWLLTDADICHDSENLRHLVVKAQTERLDLVSLMVRLRCRSVWEKALIPAFVFFFMKLYPFKWVNDPSNPTAAAAGGCILVGREILAKAGGIDAIRNTLIDDCTLAAAVKKQGGKLWLGLSETTRSLRPYPGLEEIWRMVARTAFCQLDYSPLLLAGTVFGMILLYLTPPLAFVWSVLSGDTALMLAGLVGWGLITLAYLPTVLFYRCSPLWSLALPAIGALYTAMTVDSALRYWRGEGGAWKGRVYP